MKLKTLYFLVLFLPFAFCFLPSVAHAQTMENELFKIQVGDLSSASGKINDTKYNLNIISDQGTQASSEAKPAIISNPNKDNSKPEFIKFSIQNSLIDFGSLSPTNPITRTTTLSISNSYNHGYKITGEENHKLLAIKSKSMIPDTTCDDGKCNSIYASKWVNTLTYGFGYRCDSKPNSCAKNDFNFKEKDNYKNFPDISAKESSSTILSGGAESMLGAIITYKVNISSSQPADIYSSTITFLAIPAY